MRYLLRGEAAQARPGAGGILSTFGGQVFNARALSLPVGSVTLSPFLGGDGPARRADLCRAVLEGLAFVLRANLEQVAAVIGDAASVGMTGGLTRSPFWAQLVADILGRPVRVSEIPEATALGAAICAGTGAGLFADLAEGAARLARTRTVEPNEEAARTYEALYAEWREVRAAQAEAHDRVSGRVLESMAAQATRTTVPSFRPPILVTAQMDEASLAELRWSMTRTFGRRTPRGTTRSPSPWANCWPEATSSASTRRSPTRRAGSSAGRSWPG